MSNIEKDIKFIDEMIKEYHTFGDLDNPKFEDTEKIYRSIENILAEREQDKKRIKDLEENKIRNLLYHKLEEDFVDKDKQEMAIQSYILELEDFLKNN